MKIAATHVQELEKASMENIEQFAQLSYQYITYKSKKPFP